MIINGREIQFRLDIGAYCDIADICPEGDLNRIGDSMTTFSKSSATLMKMGEIMSRAHEEWAKDEGLESVEPLTVREFRRLPTEIANELLTAVAKAFRDGQAGEVPTEPVKKKE